MAAVQPPPVPIHRDPAPAAAAAAAAAGGDVATADPPYIGLDAFLIREQDLALGAELARGTEGVVLSATLPAVAKVSEHRDVMGQ